MTVTLDKGVTVSGVTVAALVEQTIWARNYGPSVLVSGRKCPIALLVHRQGSTVALSLDGTRLSVAEVNALCPGAWQDFTDQHASVP